MLEVKAFPIEFYKINLDRKITDKDMDKIRAGRQPNGMDDRWIIYFEAPWLYFHRSWTGICIYKILIIQKEYDYYLEHVLINGNLDQYKSNKNNELRQFTTIFDLFLESKI